MLFRSDVTIHRLCIQGKDELSIFFTPGARHIGAMADRAEELGQKLPISISIGVDPAIRSVPALSRRQHRLVTMSFRLQVRCGKSRWNCAIAFR